MPQSIIRFASSLLFSSVVIRLEINQARTGKTLFNAKNLFFENKIFLPRHHLTLIVNVSLIDSERDGDFFLVSSVRCR